MFDLKGRTALVTGSTSGVGRAIARAYAEAGADLVIHGREHSSGAEEAIEECRARGADVRFLAADLTDPTDGVVPQLFADVIAAFPNVDVLVNNAGHAIDLPFEEMTLDLFERTQRLNVTAPYFLTQLFARRWIDNGVAGRVVMTGSINGRLAETGSTAYDVSKGAVEMMVKTLAVALAPRNIRVNGLAPGIVRTAATTFFKEPSQARWMEYHTPNGQFPDADVCGGGAVYLVSDEAEHVHGHMLMIDGGMAAWQQPARPAWSP